MTEFVIWVFVLLLMISGILWFGKSYDLKLNCLMASRYLAWQHAQIPETEMDPSVILQRAQIYYPMTDNSPSYNEIDIPNPATFLGEAFSFLESGNPNVKPMMLVDDFESQRNYWGFAYKTPEDIQSHFIPDVFQNTYGDSVGMITVAQAQVYNPHIEGGMFSPHWRTHLSPVQLNSGTAEAAGGYLISAGVSGEADPAAVGGLLAIIETITGDGIDQLLAH